MPKVDEVRFYRFLQNENVLLFLSFMVLVLVYIALIGNDHHTNMGVQCCGKAFWWSPLGGALALVGSSLLLRVRTARIYPVVILVSLFPLAFSAYVTMQRWNDYSGVDKGYAFNQAVLPVYRPLSIVVSIIILSVTAKRVWDTMKSTHSNELRRTH